jgi:UPF0755 protein
VADGTGGHAFSENYEQHQKHVARLRAIERGENPAPVPAVTAPAPAASDVPAPPRQPARSAPQSRGRAKPQ